MKKQCRKRLLWIKKNNFKKKRQESRQKRRKRPLENEWWDRSINAPKIFSLAHVQHRTNLLIFIDDILKNQTNNESLRINFAYTEGIVADAMLLFVSMLEKAVNSKGRFKRVRIAPPKSRDPSIKKRVLEVLSFVGAYELTGQSISLPATDRKVRNWKKLAGDTKNPLNSQEIHEFLGGGASNRESTLTVGVKEALLNIKHHAYGKTCEGEHQFGSWRLLVHEEDSIRTVVVCDLGIGIPGSVSNATDETQKRILSRIVKVAARLGRTPKDSDMIRGSVRYGRSGTGEDHRGKGLPKIESVIKSIEDAGCYLNIFSNKGCYTLSSDSPPRYTDYDQSINGTVVTWRIPSDK